VIDFDEVLSGYDVWSINWRDLVTGNFQNFDTGDPSDGFWDGTVEDPAPTPWGPDVNVDLIDIPPIDPAMDIDALYPETTKACGFPWKDQTVYASLIQAGLAKPLVPWPDQDTDCNVDTQAPGYPDGAEIHNWGGWLRSLSAHPLFFYAVIDSVYGCNRYFPGSLEYWTTNPDPTAPIGPGDNGHQWPTEWNTLTGVDIYLNATSNYSESLPTVNIEAANFYHSVGFYSADIYLATKSSYYQQDREPLPTAWAFNYFNFGPVTTDVVVWKNYDDFDYDNDLVWACYGYTYYAFDENEFSKSSTGQNCPSGTFCLTPEPNVFPFQTQKVAVNTTNFDGLPTGNGWMLLVFEPSVFPQIPPIWIRDGYMLQTYVFAKYNYGGYSTAVEATEMANYWWNFNQVLPYLNTYDGLNLCPIFVAIGGVHTDIACVDGFNLSAVH
ncbi:MAG: hypothetical protein LAO05_11865, partial [Acidobacteriia bacterium]|nr:hypothetical protein [Terriglobia bacterium]